MSELVHIFVRLGWSPATVFCVVFIGGLAVGLIMAAVGRLSIKKPNPTTV